GDRPQHPADQAGRAWARTIRTGMVTRWRTRSAVLPRSRSLKKRWPCGGNGLLCHLFRVGALNRLGGGGAEREPAADVEAALGELLAELLQVGPVVPDLVRFPDLGTLECARG